MMSKQVLHIVHWEMSGIYKVAKTLKEHGSSLNEKHKIICLRKKKGGLDFIQMFVRIFFIYSYSIFNQSIIHAHSFFPVLIQAPIFWRRLAVTFHNSYPYLISQDIKSSFKRIIIKTILKVRRAKVSSVSIETQTLLYKGISLESVVIYNGVDSGSYSYVVPSKIQIIGAAGRLDDQKNFSSLVRAAALLDPKNVKVVIAGEGVKRKELENLIAEMKVQDSFSLIGYVDDMVDFYKSIDAFICTSVYEGFGLVLAEAILSGKPLVSTKVGLASDFDCLQYFEVGVDPESIASGINDLLKLSRDDIFEIVESNKKNIEEILSVNAMYDKYRVNLWR